MLSRLQQKQGDLARFRLGRQRCFFLGSPELVEEVFITHRDDVGKRHSVTRWWLGRPEVVGQGDLFRNHDPQVHMAARKHFNQTFSSGHAFQDAGRSAEAIDRIYRAAAGQEIDLYQLAMALMTTAGMVTLLDQEPRPEEMAEVIKQSHQAIKLSVLFASRFERARPSLTRLQATVGYLEMRSLLSRFLPEHPEERPSALSARIRLLSHLETPPESVLAENITPLLGQVPSKFLRALLAVVGDTGMYESLEAELAALDGAPLGGDTLERLPGFYAAADEGLRFLPSWHLGRNVLRPFILAGQEIRYGDWFLTSPALMHRDGRYWHDPESFRLDRWEPGEAALRPRCSYMPFGVSNRICPARHLARTLIANALAVFVRDGWRLELTTPPPDWRPLTSGDWAPARPVKGRLLPPTSTGAGSAA